jgi:hypothetical protein
MSVATAEETMELLTGKPPMVKRSTGALVSPSAKTGGKKLIYVEKIRRESLPENGIRQVQECEKFGCVQETN